jgi:hypothetical protein
MRSKLIFICFWVISCSVPVLSQHTAIEGYVYDGVTKDPLPFVNIYFKGTNIGTASDTTGLFALNTDVPVDTITFSTLGYVPRNYPVKQGALNKVNVPLQPNTFDLKEVNVKPDDGPIRKLIDQLKAHKENNNPVMHDSYSYRRYTKWDYRINNVTDKMTDWGIFRHADSVFKYDNEGTRYMPAYFSEQVVLNEYQKDPLKRKSTIEADITKGLGLLEDTEISGFTSGLDDGINFYDNTIQLLEQNFISPAHDNGWFFYKYYLLDSTKTDTGKEYTVRFTPRRKGDNTFRGEMTVADGTFAITSIDADLTNTSHLNFIKALKIQTRYLLVEDSIPFFGNSKITFTIDYLPVEFKKDQKRVELKAVNSMHYADVNIGLENNVKLSHKQLAYESLKKKDYKKKDSTYWQSIRPVALDSADLEFRAGIDSVNQLPAIKLLDNMANMVMTGYYDLGNFEAGPYDEMILFNEVENTHLYFGGRTSDEISEHFSIWGGVGYGIRNEKWYGRLGAGYMLPTTRRNLISAEYYNDMMLIGENENVLYLYENKQNTSSSNLISYLFLRDKLDELFQIKRWKGSYEWEVRTGFSIKSSASSTRFNSPEFYPFISQNNLLGHFDASEIRLKFRWSWEEKYLDYGYRRIYLESSKPIINLAFTAGESNIGKRHEYYGKIHSSYKHHFYMGQARFDYALEGGWIFGTVPYPLLDIPRGNESYGVNAYNFNMMNNIEFFHDRYLHTFVECNLNGFFFKRIPLLNKLGLREIISAKTMIGSVDKKHEQLLNFPVTYSDYNNKPYAEIGLGIDNILRFFRIDAIWRATESDEAPRFGIRANMEIKI